MKITWLGHSCFMIEENGFSVIMDPYSPGSVPGYLPLDAEADMVICSHGHGDHGAVDAVRKKEGGTCPFKITGIDSWHDEVEGAKRGPNRITILEADGLKAVHMGDIGCELEPEQYEALKGADAVMIPVGGWFTAEPDVIKKMIDIIDPVVTIPMHFRTEAFGYPLIGTLDRYTDLCSNVKNYGNSIEITKGMEKQTAVLKPVFAPQK